MTGEGGETHYLKFDDCILDIQTRQITKAREVIEVQGLVFDLIVYLAARAGSVISREELLQQVWGAVHVTDSALSQGVKKARHALGDDGQTQSHIRTIHGKGFMFVADVQVEASAAVATPRPPQPTVTKMRARPLLAAVFAVVFLWLFFQPPSEQNLHAAFEGVSVTILPFANRIDAADLDWIALGLSDTLAELLSFDSTMRVARASSFPDLGPVKAAQAMALFGTEFAVEVTVTRDSAGYGFEYFLIGSEGTHSSGQLTGLDLAVLTRNLADTLRSNMSGIELQRVELPAALNDPLVMELSARAQHAFHSGRFADTKKLLQAALTRRPESPELKLRLIQVEAETDDRGGAIQQFEQLLDISGGEISAALRGDILQRIANQYWLLGRYAESRSALEGALEQVDEKRNPVVAAQIYNSMALNAHVDGDLESAWQLFNVALNRFREIKSDYLVSVALSNLGILAEDMGHIGKARDLQQEALQIRSRYAFAELIAASQYGLARALRHLGRFAEAQALISQTIETTTRLDMRIDLFDNLEEMAEIQFSAGHLADALETIEKARVIAVEDDDELAQAWADNVKGRILFALGEREQAVILTEHSLAEQSALEAFQEAANARLDLIEMLTQMGRLDDARDHLQQFASFKELPASAQSIRISLLEGALEVARGEVSATDHLTMVLQNARGSGAADLEAQAALILGGLAIERDDLLMAEAMLAVAQQWSEQSPEPLCLRAALLQARGDSAELIPLRSRWGTSFPELSCGALAPPGDH